MKTIYITTIDMEPGFNYDNYADMLVPILAKTLNEYAQLFWIDVFGRRKTPSAWSCSIRIVSSLGLSESILRGPDVSHRHRGEYYAIWLREDLANASEYTCDVLNLTANVLIGYDANISEVTEAIREVCSQIGMPEVMRCIDLSKSI